VCDNIINTLLGVEGKTKDNINSRYDLEEHKIRSDLHPIDLNDEEVCVPPAPYAIELDQQKIVCKVIKSATFPPHYAADICHNVHVKDRKITG
jgi:hypothetical protein